MSILSILKKDSQLGNESFQNRIFVYALIAIVFFVYANSLTGEFLSDDRGDFTESQCVSLFTKEQLLNQHCFVFL